jgi:hypothetical protein
VAARHPQDGKTRSCSNRFAQPQTNAHASLGQPVLGAAQRAADEHLLADGVEAQKLARLPPHVVCVSEEVGDEPALLHHNVVAVRAGNPS